MNEIKVMYESLMKVVNTYKNLKLGPNNREVYYEMVEKYRGIIENKIVEIKNYISKEISNIYKSPHKVGLVFNKFEEDIVQGRFYIWIDKGYTIDHKFIYIK